MQLGNFKRNYRYKSDTSSGRTGYWLAILISIVAFVVIWYFF